MPNPKTIQQSVLEYAQIACANVDGGQDGSNPKQRAVSVLFLAFCDGVRDVWQDYASNDSVLAARLAIARRVMAANGYEGDPIVGPPGAKPFVAKVGHQECISYEHNLPSVTPLSAVFLALVTQVMNAAEKEAAEAAARDIEMGAGPEPEEIEREAKALFKLQNPNSPLEWVELAESGRDCWRMLAQSPKVREVAQMLRDAEAACADIEVRAKERYQAARVIVGIARPTPWQELSETVRDGYRRGVIRDREAKAKLAYEREMPSDTPLWADVPEHMKAIYRTEAMMVERETAHHDGQIPNDAPSTAPGEA